VSNDDRREWEPYGTERGDDARAREPQPGPGGPGQDFGPGYTGYDPQAAVGTGGGTQGLDPVAFAPGQYGQDPNAYVPNAYDPGYAPNTYDANAYDPNAYHPDPYDPNAYDPNGYAPAPIPRPSVNPAEAVPGVGAARPARERPTPSSPPGEDGRVPPPRARKGAGGRPGGGRPGRPGYGSDEFAFVDDESEQAEDVIDWLSFAETRSERRDERRRTIRLRLIGLAAVIAVALVGVGGYVAWDTWLADDKSASRAGGNGAVLVQLRSPEGRSTANAILTVDPARKSASMVTVSSTAVVNADNSPYPLGQLMADEGPGASRDALSDLLGVRLDGSWVVSEPVLQGLVDLTGGIQLNADVGLKGPDGKALVTQGRNRANGAAALAFAKYTQRGEPAAISGDRFGRVLQALLAVLPTDPGSVLSLLANMANVPDPSLPDDKLSAMLGALAEATQAERLQVRALPMSVEGILDLPAATPIVRDLLGGTVREGGEAKEGPVRVMVDDASGKAGAQGDAQARLLNAGVTYVPGGAEDKRAQETSTVQYADDARAEDAAQIAMTLKLPTSAVEKAQGEMLADVVVTLGRDYRFVAPPTS